MLWYLLLLATVGVVVYVIWNYRRGTAARKAASAARFDKMFKAEVQLTPGAQLPTFFAADTSPLAKSAPAASIAPAVAAERFLGKSESLLYYLLKAGLPDHEIFAGVSLTRFIVAAGDGREREQQLRRLAQYTLDFVVCDKSMQVIAVVEVETAAAATAAGDQRFKAETLKQAGIRLVRINPTALPRREQVRAFINGESPQQGV